MSATTSRLIETTNRIDTAAATGIAISWPVNRRMITRQIIRAARVHSAMARWICTMRRSSTPSSVWWTRRDVSSSEARPSSSARHLSTTLARRFAITFSNAPMPASVKTGAMASWIICAMSEGRGVISVMWGVRGDSLRTLPGLAPETPQALPIAPHLSHKPVFGAETLSLDPAGRHPGCGHLIRPVPKKPRQFRRLMKPAPAGAKPEGFFDVDYR